MNTTTTRSAIRTVLNSFDQLGIKAPAQVTKAAERYRDTTKAAEGLGAHPDALAVAVTNALERGADPTTDADVQRIITANALAAHGTRDAVIRHMSDLAGSALIQDSDAIVTAWRAPFTSAADALTTAHQRFGDVDLTDAAAVLASGGNAADVWTRATNASQTIVTIINGWGALSTLATGNPPDAKLAPLRLSDPTFTQWATLKRNHRASAWDLVRAGQTLSLPTLPEYRQRVAAITQAQREHDQQQAEAVRPRSFEPRRITA